MDFESARNAAAYAYLPAEALLAKLESLTGTAAAAQGLQQYQEMYRWGGTCSTCMQYMQGRRCMWHWCVCSADGQRGLQGP